MKYFLILLSLFLYSCSGKVSQEKLDSANLVDSEDFNFNVEFKHSKKVKVVNHKDYKELIMVEPTDQENIQTYILALKGSMLPQEVLDKGIVIHVPVNSIVGLSATHIGALEILGLHNYVTGAISTDRFWDEQIQERVREGKIVEVGRGMVANIEQIIKVKPDIVTTSDTSLMAKYKDLSSLGIIPVYNNDWRESTLLGRAEWMKVMALFFCKSMQADSVFSAIEDRYNETKRFAKTANRQPKVFVGQETRGTWYIPGSESYVAGMIHDANGTMSTIHGEKTNYPCGFEMAYTKYHDADFWFTQRGSAIKTLKEFGSTSEHYEKFKAFQEGLVFINNKRLTSSGGNDFWESGVYHPDVVLLDLVSILHPELLPNYETVYWRMLE